MTTLPISPDDPHPRARVPVLDSSMSYVDIGQGSPVVFLHGNPTSSYLWRNVMPPVAVHTRCLAPDLIGMGRSGALPSGRYGFSEHARYLDAWFDAIGLTQPVVLVVHDWGSALGFDWARRHAARVRGIVYMEALVQPRLWSDFPAGRDQIFRRLRSAEGERLIRGENFFIEAVLPKSVLRTLPSAEMDRYRAPFLEPASRSPMLAWARDLPIEGDPPDVVERVDAYGRWLATSTVPKLFVNVEPGALLGARARAFCRTWPNQQEITVRGIHYVQEDAPHEIGAAIGNFVQSLAHQGAHHA